VGTQSCAARFEGLSNAYPDKEVWNRIVFLVLHNIQDVQVLGTGNMSGEWTGVTLCISEETLALLPYKSVR
jgi:hypothetical protein